MFLKEPCRRCGGNLFLSRDDTFGALTAKCLQCSREIKLKKGAPPSRHKRLLVKVKVKKGTFFIPGVEPHLVINN